MTLTLRGWVTLGTQVILTLIVTPCEDPPAVNRSDLRCQQHIMEMEERAVRG